MPAILLIYLPERSISSTSGRCSRVHVPGPAPHAGQHLPPASNCSTSALPPTAQPAAASYCPLLPPVSESMNHLNWSHRSSAVSRNSLAYVVMSEGEGGFAAL